MTANDVTSQPGCRTVAATSQQHSELVAYLEAVGLDALQHQPLKEGLAQPCPGSLLVDDDRPQLTVVPNQHSLLGSQDQGNERLGLCCLGGLIHQQLQVQCPCCCMQSECLEALAC